MLCLTALAAFGLTLPGVAGEIPCTGAGEWGDRSRCIEGNEEAWKSQGRRPWKGASKVWNLQLGPQFPDGLTKHQTPFLGVMGSRWVAHRSDCHRQLAGDIFGWLVPRRRHGGQEGTCLRLAAAALPPGPTHPRVRLLLGSCPGGTWQMATCFCSPALLDWWPWLKTTQKASLRSICLQRGRRLIRSPETDKWK